MSIARLKQSVVSNLIEKASKKEMDFILYACRIQNDFGNVRGLNYKYVSLDLGISQQSFYNILRSLEDKEIIKVDWTNGKDWNIQIIGNDFINYKSYREGYVKQHPFLYDSEFTELNIKARRVILKLLKCQRPDKYFQISKRKLRKWIDCCKSDLDKYLCIIMKYFNVNIRTSESIFDDSDDMLFVKLKKYYMAHTKTKEYKYIIHRITTWCRRFKICYTNESLKDVFFLFLSNIKKKLRTNKLVKILCDTGLQYKSLEPALINKILCSSK